MGNREIAGKTVLITGAYGGIGRALVNSFLAADAARIIAASRSPHPVDDPRIVPLALDVRSRAAARMVAAAHRVDILVNNAGVNTNAAALAGAESDNARNEMDVNYFGVLNLSSALSPQMTTRGEGVIVNILSAGSLKLVPRMSTYCASKAAAWFLTQALRSDLSGTGVAVLAIFPRATDTVLTAHLDVPKLAPATVADATVQAIRDGVADLHFALPAED